MSETRNDSMISLLHMSCVSEIDAWLVSTFVWSVLKRYYILTSFKLFIGEVANILLSFFWSDSRFSEVVSLKTKKVNTFNYLNNWKDSNCAYLSPQWLQANHDRIQILTFPQINWLERLLNRDSEFFCIRQESWNIFHTLECHFTLVYFLHWSWLKSVCQFAKDNSILEDFIKVVHVSGRVDWLAGDLLDPFQAFICKFIAVFWINL